MPSNEELSDAIVLEGVTDVDVAEPAAPFVIVTDVLVAFVALAVEFIPLDLLPLALFMLSTGETHTGGGYPNVCRSLVENSYSLLTSISIFLLLDNDSSL